MQSVTHRQTDRQADAETKTNIPPQLRRSWGHNHRAYHFRRIKTLEIVKCKSINGTSESDVFFFYYLTEVLMGKFD